MAWLPLNGQGPVCMFKYICYIYVCIYTFSLGGYLLSRLHMCNLISTLFRYIYTSVCLQGSSSSELGLCFANSNIRH